MSMSNQKEWVTILGYSKYKIDRLGRIVGPRGKILKPEISHGRLSVCIVGNDGVYRSRRVSRLLAIAFLQKSETDTLVRHLNDNPLDNRIENLAWGTQKDNGLDRIRNSPFAHLKSIDNLQKGLLRKVIKEKTIAMIVNGEKTISEIARICHLSVSAISRRMTRGGYKPHSYCVKVHK